MSLTKPSLVGVIWRQYVYKLVSYTDAIKSLMIVQLIAIIFTIIGGSGGSTSDGNITITVNQYSVGIVFFFTMMWIFITSILLTSKAYQYEDFSYVTNRLSSQLANGLYLLTGVVVGTVTTVLSSFLIYMLITFFKEVKFLNGITAIGSPNELLMTAGGVCFYLLLASAIGYFAGALTQVSKILMLVFPAVFIVLPMFFVDSAVVQYFYSFYFLEPSLALFGVKILLTSLLLFIFSVLIFNSREVRV